MTISPANLTNTPEISGLYQELNACMAALSPQDFCAAKQDEGFIRSVIEDEQSDFLLARDGEEVLGFALVQQKTTPPYPAFLSREYVYLMDIVVGAAYRHRGVGTLLLKAVEDWAKARGAEFIELGVLSGNLPAIAAYEKAGYIENRKTMRLAL